MHGLLSTWWFSAILGVGIVGASTLIRVVTHRGALRASSITGATRATVRGILLRMALVLGGLALAVTMLPVHKTAFVIALVTALVVSVVLEPAVIWRHTSNTCS